MGSDEREGSAEGTDTGPTRPDAGLWERFLAGETSPAEEARLRAWHSSGGAQGSSPDTVRALARAHLTSDVAPTVDPQAMLRALESRLDLRRTRVHRASPLSSPLARYRATIGAVACAAAVVVALVVRGASRVPSVASVRVGPEDTGTYRTGERQRLRLHLAEGLEVAAAPGSAVRVTGTPEHRDVYVTGEAYIDANDVSLHAPTVHAGNTVVQSVRARFTVRTDTDAHEVRVAVAGGVVVLGDSGAPWRSARMLTPDHFAAVSMTGVTRVFEATEPDAAMLWESGAARWGREGLRDVLPRQG